MRAIVYERFGGPEVLHLEEVEKPVPGDGEVLVRVRAASVNSWDWDLLRGVPSILRLGKPPHRTLGADIAGTVEQLGSHATGCQPGDEVFGDLSGCGWGGFAEYVCAPESVFAVKPARLSFEKAAAVPQAGVIALQALRDFGRLQPGQDVLINGAGGGVGLFAIQLARIFGAEVTGVDRADKLDTMRSLGAEHVVDFTREDFTRTGRRYDLIIDVAGGRTMLAYRRAMNTGGTLVLVGGAMWRLLVSIAVGAWLTLIRGIRVKILVHRPNRKDLQFLSGLIDAGKIDARVDRCFTLQDVPQAFRFFGEGHVRGKVVVTVADDGEAAP